MSPVKHTVCTLFIGLFLWLGMTQCNRKQAVTCTPRPHDDTITVVFKDAARSGFEAGLWNANYMGIEYTIIAQPLDLEHLDEEKNLLPGIFNTVFDNKGNIPLNDVYATFIYFNKEVENSRLALDNPAILGYSIYSVPDNQFIHELFKNGNGQYTSVEGYTFPVPYISHNNAVYNLAKVLHTEEDNRLGYILIHNLDNYDEEGNPIKEIDRRVPRRYNTF